LYIFFWVFPRRQIVVGRRFGTLCQFHLQRLDVVLQIMCPIMRLMYTQKFASLPCFTTIDFQTIFRIITCHSVYEMSSQQHCICTARMAHSCHHKNREMNIVTEGRHVVTFSVVCVSKICYHV